MLDLRRAATIQTAISDAFDLGPEPTLTGPVARGEVGQIWKLTTATATWAVKESLGTVNADEAEHDAQLQEAATAANIKVPAVRRSVDGDVLVDIDGSKVRVYSWVDVLTADRFVDPTQVGAVVAAIHRLHCDSSNGVHPWYTDPLGTARWRDLVADLLAGNAPFAEQLAAQLDDIATLEQLLVPPSELRPCHRDLFADNVLNTPAGQLCVIDWENSGLADPSQELAVVLFEFGCGQPDRLRTLTDAYTGAGGPGRITNPSDFSMLIAQLGHIAEDACTRWLDPTRRHERDRNERRIGEFLNDRLAHETILLILDTIV